MIVHRARRAAPGLLAALASLAVAACGSTPKSLWPFGSEPVEAPAPADEVVFDRIVSGPATPVFPQYWRRNTLVIDLQGIAGSGELRMRPRTAAGWPVRIAFRVAPGAVDRLEIRGEQRIVWPLDGGATAPIEFELPPGAYRATTPEIRLIWGPGSLTPGGPPIMAPGAPAAVPAPSPVAAPPAGSQSPPGA
jgi:hypothetical protein